MRFYYQWMAFVHFQKSGPQENFHLWQPEQQRRGLRIQRYAEHVFSWLQGQDSLRDDTSVFFLSKLRTIQVCFHLLSTYRRRLACFPTALPSY